VRPAASAWPGLWAWQVPSLLPEGSAMPLASARPRSAEWVLAYAEAVPRLAASATAYAVVMQPRAASGAPAAWQQAAALALALGAAALQQVVAAQASGAEAAPRQVAAARASDAEMAPRQVVAAQVSDAEAVPLQAAEQELDAEAALQPAVVMEASGAARELLPEVAAVSDAPAALDVQARLPAAPPLVVRLSAAALVVRRDLNLPSYPVLRRSARSAHAMGIPQAASPSTRSWQAARDEGLSS
jgi:hypothetical protein